MIRSTSRLRAPLALAATALLVAGCSDGGEPEALPDLADASPDTAPSEPTAPAEPDDATTDAGDGSTDDGADDPADDEAPPAGEPVDRSDADLGIAFTLGDVDDAAVAAVDAYTAYELATWRSLTTNELDDAITGVAGESPVGELRDRLQIQQENDFTLGGEVRITVEGVDAVVTGQGEGWAVNTCLDQSDVVAVVDGEPMQADEGDEAVSTATVLPVGEDTWTVVSTTTEVTPC